MSNAGTKWAQWTPSRAIRRKSSRRILIFLTRQESTPNEIKEYLKLSERTVFRCLKGLREIGYIDKIIEDGTRAGYKTSDAGKTKLIEKGYLSNDRLISTSG